MVKYRALLALLVLAKYALSEMKDELFNMAGAMCSGGMGSIPVGDSDIFFVPHPCHVE